MRTEDLPELGVVKIATPCTANWEQMRGTEAVRFCDVCRRHVYNFAELTTTEARELLVQTEGRLCGRIFTREDGTVLTRDCQPGQRDRRNRVGAAIAAASLLVPGGVALQQSLDAQCEPVVQDRAPSVAAGFAGPALPPPAPALRSMGVLAPTPRVDKGNTYALGGIMRPFAKPKPAVEPCDPKRLTVTRQRQK